MPHSSHYATHFAAQLRQAIAANQQGLVDEFLVRANHTAAACVA